MIRVFNGWPAALALALAGWVASGPARASEPGAGKVAAAAPFTVVASFYPMYVTVLNVAGGIPGVNVENLTPPAAGCPEDYALSPADLKLLHGADVLVVNGAGIEGFIDKVVSQNSRLKIVQASEGLPKLRTGIRVNPHWWVSPVQAAQQARVVAAALATLDPDASHGSIYIHNAEIYATRLESLARQMQQSLTGNAPKRVVAFHESLSYLAKDLGWEVVAVIEPTPGQSPNARQLADVVEKVRAQPGPVVLLTEQDMKNPAAQTLGRELNQPVYSLDTVVSGPLEPAAACGAYVRAMEENLATLQKAFNVPAGKSN